MKLSDAFAVVRFLFMKIIGLLCVVIGIVGIFLPIIPGIPLIFLGFAFLGVEPLYKFFKSKKT